MTAAVKILRRIVVAVVVLGACGLGIYAFDAVLHLLGFQTQVVAGVVLCIAIVAGLMWWATERLDTGVEEIRAIGNDLDESRIEDRVMREDVYAMRVAIGEWLDATRDWMAQSEPETQPMERIGTDTVETERVIDDEWLAAARKRWDEIAAEPVEKPSPKPRTRTRKATT